MKLVPFKLDHRDENVYINPEHVAAVFRSSEFTQATDIVLAPAALTYRVRAGLSEVLHALGALPR